ncbi:hypothetical protein BC832DRAFT_560260 [Gaertneriomyces semiglobifer]|nr:hypothetical protein BC832DRAFT_560260 [Gaertneriomyces semiglobifer]
MPPPHHTGGPSKSHLSHHKKFKPYSRPHKTTLDIKKSERKTEAIRRTRIKRDYYKLLEKEGGGDVDWEEEMKERVLVGVAVGEDQEGINDEKEIPNEKEEEEGGKVGGREEPSRPGGAVGRRSGKAREENANLGKKRANGRPVKPNPFAKQVAIAAERKAAREAAIAEAARLRAEQQRGRQEYYKQRNAVKSKMVRKTKKGQPVMASQIELLLGKIKQG